MARLIAALLAVAAMQQPAGGALVRSPDGRVAFRAWIDGERRARYEVTMGGRALIEPSALGMVVDKVTLTRDAEIVSSTPSSTDREYPMRGGHSVARERSNNLRIDLRHARSSTRFALEVRAFDDGVAFRYVVPGTGKRTPDEGTEFRLPSGATVWYHDMQGHYEGMHVRKEIGEVAFGEWAAPPVTFKLAAGGYGSITEGALTGYSGMSLEADGARGFHGRLAHDHPLAYPYYLRYQPPDTRRVTAAATLDGPITTPWRIVLAARDLNALVNADVVRHVSAPPDPALFSDLSWIRPGRAVWRFLDGGDNTFEGLKGFTELAARLGFEYHVVEGIWQRWTPEQLKEFVDHARARRVGIWLWKDSRAIREPEARRAFFALCRDLGIAGVKIDFLDHEAKEVIDHYETILREAAAAHVMVDFHGANKPTGGERTFPNELTREGVYGLEHRGAESWAAHNTTLPFTRYLAGPGDYTPVVFGERRKDTTWAHQIATAAIFTSPLLVYGAHPQSLVDSAAVDVIKAIPATWDETIALPQSAIGEVAAFARRSGIDWFVAVLNGAAARKLTLDLGFLAAGRRYDATLVGDTADNPAAVTLDTRTLNRTTPLAIDLHAGGGFLARIRPATP